MTKYTIVGALEFFILETRLNCNLLTIRAMWGDKDYMDPSKRQETLVIGIAAIRPFHSSSITIVSQL